MSFCRFIYSTGMLGFNSCSKRLLKTRSILKILLDIVDQVGLIGNLGLDDFNQYKFHFTWSGSSQNKNRSYYCLRATDELGYWHFRLVNIDDF